MAIALVANRANLGFVSAVGANSLAITGANLITPANTLFLLVYAQNNTSNAASIPPGSGTNITDPRGNTWYLQGYITSSDGGSNHGGTLAVYKAVVIAPYLAGDALSITGAIAGLSVAAQIHEFSGVSMANQGIVLNENKGISGTGSTGLPITVSASGQLVLVAGGAGTTSAVTSDSDTLDGTWTASFLKTASPLDMWESHKILTGFTSSTQNYQATWTNTGGDNTWAQIALTYDPTTPQGFPITQQLPPQDNPNFGCPDAGFEPLPTGNAVVPIDTGTAYQIEHTIPNYSFGTHAYSVVAQYDNTSPSIQQHHIAYDLYQTGSEVPQDPIVTLTFPVNYVNMGADSYVLDSTGTQTQAGPQTNSALAKAALQTPGGSYIKLDATPTASTSPYQPYVEVQFDLTGATGLSPSVLSDYLNNRVIRMGIRFNAWKDNSSTTAIPVGEGLQFVYHPAMSDGVVINSYFVELGAWLTPDYQRAATQQLRWFGETNPLPKIPLSSVYYGNVGSDQTQWFRTPPDGGTSWSYNDVLQMGSGSDLLRIYGLAGADFSQTTVYLDFLELVIEVVPERRLGNVSLNIATSPQYANSPLGSAQYIPGRVSVAKLQNVVNQNSLFTVTGSPNDYQLVAREALPASTSDYYPALATAPGAPNVGGVLVSTFGANVPFNLPQYQGVQLYTPQEAVGPSLNLLGYTQARTMSPNQRPLTQRAVVDGVFATSATLITDFTLSMGAWDGGNYLLAGSMFPVFQGLASLANIKVYNGHNLTQKFFDGTGSYDQLRIVCKPDPLTTASLSFTLSPDVTTITSITPAQALAGEPLGNGWFAVTTPCTLFTGSNSAQTLTISSTTGFGAPWLVAGVQTVGNTAITNFEPNINNFSYLAYAAELECSLAAPNISNTNSISYTITPPSHITCLTNNTLTVPSLTISNGSLFDYLVTERSVGGVAPWTYVSTITDPIDGQRIIDFEAPWDISQFSSSTRVFYRVTGYRNSDRRSTTVTSGPMAFAGSPGPVIGFASNILQTIFIYAPTDATDLHIKWNALNQVQMIPQHMRDYQYALRTPENRGLTATFPVEVNQFIQCTQNVSSPFFADYQTEMLTYYTEQIAQGKYAFTPRPYEVSLLPVFNAASSWMLLLPGGHQRRVTVTLGDMTITTVNGAYMAELTVTDTVIPSTNPYGS